MLMVAVVVDDSSGRERNCGSGGEDGGLIGRSYY